MLQGAPGGGKTKASIRQIVERVNYLVDVTGTGHNMTHFLDRTRNPACPEFWDRQDPHVDFASMRLEKPVHWHAEPVTRWSPEGGRGFWSIVNYDDVVSVSRDQKTFTSGCGVGLADMPPDMVHAYGGMLSMSGRSHTQHRAITNRAFTLKSVDALDETIRRSARSCIDRVAADGSCDFAADIVRDFPARIICELLGVPAADRTRLIDLTDIALGIVGSPESYGAMLEIIRYAEDLVAQTRGRVPETALLLRLLLDAPLDGGPLPEREIAIYMSLFVTAGLETPAACINQGMYAMSLHPDQRRRWQQNFHEFAPRAVEELLRWTTPVKRFRRTATRDTEIAGQPIAQGDKVVVWYISANRDERVFERAGELDFSREGRQSVGYGGGGPHFCLGGLLANKEITIFFEELFRRLPDIEVSGSPLRAAESTLINGLLSLPVSYTPAPLASVGHRGLSPLGH